MTKRLCAVTALAAILAGSGAAAQTGSGDGGRIYVGLGLGVAYVTDDGFEGTDTLPREGGPIDFSGSLDQDWGGTGNLFLGYRVTERVSVELESSAWIAEADRFGGDYAGRSLLSVNAVVWGDQSARLIPYGGVGLGYSRFAVDDDGEVFEFGNGLGYKLKGGAILPVGRSHAFGIEASFASGETIEIEESEFVDIEQDFDAIGLALTYRYQFGGYPGR